MKIHIICDSPKTLSGFSRVGINLAVGLRKLGHEVHMTGFQTSFESDVVNCIEVMPSNVQYIDDVTQFINNVQKKGTDIIICIFNGDDANQNKFARVMKPCFWYVPIEGRNIPEFMTEDIRYVSECEGKIIAQCNYGHNEMKRWGIESSVIYHGYNPEIFRKLDKVPRAQVCHEKINVLGYTRDSEKLFKWNSVEIEACDLHKIFKGKFIFGFVGANHGLRKKIERLLKAYSLFLGNDRSLKDRTLLVLRTMPISITGIDLIKICRDLGISNNVIFLYGDNNRLTDESMNVIYNCFDVNVSCSGSEGFGFSTLESMAVGVPQIAPYCSSFIELIGEDEDKRGLLVREGLWNMMPDQSERFLVNEEKFAEKMLTMFGREDFRKACGKRASEWAKQFTWDKVVKQWNDLLTS